MLKAIKAIDRAFHPVDRFIAAKVHGTIEDFQDGSASKKVMMGAVAAGGSIVASLAVLDVMGHGSAADEIYENLKVRVHGWNDRLLESLGVERAQDMQAAQAVSVIEQVEISL